MCNQIRRVILFAVEYKKQSTGITVSSLYSHKQKNRCVVVYPAYKEHLHYTYEWLVKKKNTNYWGNLPFIAPFIKNSPMFN